LATGQDDVIVRATIDLAHNLGLTVVAEGVENDDVQGRLVALGCDFAQGTFIRPPVPAADLRAWIAGQNLLSLM
jgi:diguanylate cyclase